jgi:hypothetical protein
MKSGGCPVATNSLTVLEYAGLNGDIVETTTAVAQKFHVSLGRVSQLRRELQQAWVEFVAERPAGGKVCAV